jgi:hypothetical protein
VRVALALFAAAVTFVGCWAFTWLVGQPEVMFLGIILPAMVYSSITEVNERRS